MPTQSALVQIKNKATKMRATFLKGNSDHRSVMWEVHEGDRWWTVAFLTADGSYHVTSDNGREVKADGRMGKKIIAATKS